MTFRSNDIPEYIIIYHHVAKLEGGSFVQGVIIIIVIVIIIIIIIIIPIDSTMI